MSKFRYFIRENFDILQWKPLTECPCFRSSSEKFFNQNQWLGAGNGTKYNMLYVLAKLIICKAKSRIGNFWKYNINCFMHCRTNLHILCFLNANLITRIWSTFADLHMNINRDDNNILAESILLWIFNNFPFDYCNMMNVLYEIHCKSEYEQSMHFITTHSSDVLLGLSSIYF